MAIPSKTKVSTENFVVYKTVFCVVGDSENDQIEEFRKAVFPNA